MLNKESKQLTGNRKTYWLALDRLLSYLHMIGESYFTLDLFEEILQYSILKT